jgi:DNA-binding NtrC family response regulator
MPDPSQVPVSTLDPGSLGNALGSPLRLRLVAELLEAGRSWLALDELVVRTGRHVADIQACLRPMVGWGLLEVAPDGGGWRLRGDIPGPLMETLARVVAARSDQIARERRVSRQVLGGMIGLDPKMQLVFDLMLRVARLDVTVLITGETGTGKELVARALHELSGRRERPFGVANCPTLTDELFASEMFGHVRGAFTGAVRGHAGLLERCHRGTLLLDELGDLTLPNQAKLLRALQEGTYARVGDEEVRHGDVRIVSATNRDLDTMVAAGAFREDLLYRLNVIPLRLPSLRERLGDLPYLAEALLGGRLRELAGGSAPPTVTPRALARLCEHTWPGNIRELENVLMQALLRARDGVVDREHLPPLGSEPPRAAPRAGRPSPSEPAALLPLREVERRHVAAVLAATAGNIAQAAAILEVSRTTLYKKIRDYGLELGGG